jgi:hypothetical protein
MSSFREKFGIDRSDEIGRRLHDLATQFVHEVMPAEKKKEPVRS